LAGERELGVAIDDQHPPGAVGEQHAEVRSGRGLAHAALLVLCRVAGYAGFGEFAVWLCVLSADFWMGATRHNPSWRLGVSFVCSVVRRRRMVVDGYLAFRVEGPLASVAVGL
jgi:hypothetical protein